MDYSPEKSLGQQNVEVSGSTVAEIAHQCALLTTLRAWYEHFAPTIREIDATAAIKAHDLIVEGATTSTRLARQLQFSLPDVSEINWQLSPRVDAQGRL